MNVLNVILPEIRLFLLEKYDRLQIKNYYEQTFSQSNSPYGFLTRIWTQRQFVNNKQISNILIVLKVIMHVFVNFITTIIQQVSFLSILQLIIF